MYIPRSRTYDVCGRPIEDTIKEKENYQSDKIGERCQFLYFLLFQMIHKKIQNKIDTEILPGIGVLKYWMC